MITDKNAFLPHTRLLQVRGINERFYINLNMNVGTYYTVMCLFDGYGTASDNEKIEILLESTTQILHLANRKINRNWIRKNIDIQEQSEIVVKVIDGVNELLTADYLQIPNIKVKEKPNTSKYERDRAEKKKQIEQANNILAKKQETNLIDDITLVMMKTSNTYKDIMDMPILAFRAIVKSIIINEMRTDDDYNLAYLNYELNKYKNEINSGKAVIAPSNKGANLKELKRFFG
jgi:hypothetical protein